MIEMANPDPNSEEYRYDYDHVEIDHDSDEKEIKGHDFNPVEEGSALHLEIHRAVDELGKYALEMDLMPKTPIKKDDLKKFIEELMRVATVECLNNGADLVGHVKSFLIVEGHGNIMSSLVDAERPVKIKDALDLDEVSEAVFVLHVIVHGIWDDKIRELTLKVMPDVCKKWNIDYKILADYYDLEKSIAHHNLG